MKKYLSALASLVLLFACTPEENKPSGSDEPGGGSKTIHVTGISLDNPSATLKEGETIVLVATVTPDNATNKAITWSSSSDAVATVDNNGKVTGVKAGSATITATTEGGGKKATCALSVEANLAPSVTVEANHVSAISAVLAGKANLGSTVASDLKVGFQYSKSAGILPSNSTTVEAMDADANYNYTTSITGLDPATSYYYRSFVRQNGQDTYGETKSFATKDVASLLETRDASGIEATKATLNAKLDLTDVQYKSLAYGFLWGSSESALNTDFKCTEIKDNAIAASLTNLSHNTPYWYKAYVKLDSQIFYGEVKTFTTDVVPVESVSLDKTEYTFHTIGNTLSLKAIILPYDAADTGVEWSSDKEDVATVDASGKVTAKGNGTATITVTVTTKDQGKTATCAITVAQYVTGITLSSTSMTLNEGQEQTLTATINPNSAADKSLKWTSSDEGVAAVDQTGKVTAVSKGSATIKAIANDGSGVSAFCAVSVKHTAVAVDLGLSVKWSSMNLGATSPTGYGDYFAWGETSPKDNYNWATYKWSVGSSSTLTRYNNSSNYGNVDNKTEFKDYNYEDDAARQALGGKWRIPTRAEWTELKEQCSWTWTTQNGVDGSLVTSKINGNSIFLPAAGSRYGTDLRDVGAYGNYWSSSLLMDHPLIASYVLFGSGGFCYYMSELDVSRCYGFSVRPVSE